MERDGGAKTISWMAGGAMDALIRSEELREKVKKKMFSRGVLNGVERNMWHMFTPGICNRTIFILLKGSSCANTNCFDFIY